MERRITDLQYETLEHYLPAGIVDRQKLQSEDSRGVRARKRAIKGLEDQGYLRKIAMRVKDMSYRDESRFVITRSGIDALIQAVDEKNPLKGLMEYTHVSARNELNAKDFLRQIRIADASGFFAGVGVMTSYSAVVHHGVDPFLFGLPEITKDKRDPQLLSDAIRSLLIRYIQSRRSMGHPLRMASTEIYNALFLSAADIPAVMISDKSGQKIRATNNSVGLLLDFDNRNVYLVFRELNRTSWPWNETAYKRYIPRLANALKGMGIKNIDEYGNMQDALILCDTPTEMCIKAKQIDKVGKLFKRILCFLTDQEGAGEICSLLNMGCDDYLTTTVDPRILKAAGFVSKPKSEKPDWCQWKLDGRHVYMGTTIDYGSMLRVKESLEIGYDPYILCREWQKKIYLKAFDESRILTVSSNGDKIQRPE